MKVLKFIYFVCFFLLAGTLSAGDSPKIMLINSDASVEKYELAQEEFKKTILHPVMEVNLGETKWKISDVEDMLYDEYPDLIYCIGTKAYLVANKFVSEKEIIFSSIVNWHRLPMTPKTYGVSNELHSEMQITIFRYIFPRIKKIGVLYSDKYNRQRFKNIQKEAKEIGVEIIGQAVSKSSNTVSSLKEILRKIDALWLISDPVILSDKDILTDMFKVCDPQKIPVFSYHEVFIKQGAVLIVSVDIPTIGRQAASIAAEILAGSKMEDKVQFPAGSHVILNLEKAKKYGLHYKAEGLAVVNQIIE